MKYSDHSTLRPVLCVVEAHRSWELERNCVSKNRVFSPTIAENHQTERSGPIAQGLDTASLRTTQALRDGVGLEEEPNIRLHPP